MSVDLLREAAFLMRERAEEAEYPGYESLIPGKPWCPEWTYIAVSHVYHNLDIECPKHGDEDYKCNRWGRYAGVHISGMTPVMALGVADLLDKMSRLVEAGIPIPFANEAIAIARTYLGVSNEDR